MTGSAAFLEAVQARRSYYDLSSEPILSDAQLQAILQQAVLHAPTVFNVQSGRAVLFTGSSSQKLWDIVSDIFLATLKDNAPLHKIMTEKLLANKAGYGTVAFFEDQKPLEALRSTARMPHFTPAHFDHWSEKSTGMLQFIVWTALEAEGYGASIQHHTTYVDSMTPAILEAFGLPDSWKCTTLMPFGKPIGPPGMVGREKTYEPIDARVKAFQ